MTINRWPSPACIKTIKFDRYKWPIKLTSFITTHVHILIIDSIIFRNRLSFLCGLDCKYTLKTAKKENLQIDRQKMVFDYTINTLIYTKPRRFQRCTIDRTDAVDRSRTVMIESHQSHIVWREYMARTNLFVIINQ